MRESEIFEVDAAEETAACDGGGGPLGHPLIYLRFEGKPQVDCYYCSRRFVKKTSQPPQAQTAQPVA